MIVFIYFLTFIRCKRCVNFFNSTIIFLPLGMINQRRTTRRWYLYSIMETASDSRVVPSSLINHPLNTGPYSWSSMKNICFCGSLLFLLLYFLSKEPQKQSTYDTIKLLSATINAVLLLNMKGCFFLSAKKTWKQIMHKHHNFVRKKLSNSLSYVSRAFLKLNI